MEQQDGSDVKDKPKDRRGPPIWVESLLTSEEYKETAKLYPNTFTKGGVAPSYNDKYHKGGKWRNRMGGGYTEEEIKVANTILDNLHNIIQEARKKLAQQEANGQVDN